MSLDRGKRDLLSRRETLAGVGVLLTGTAGCTTNPNEGQTETLPREDSEENLPGTQQNTNTQTERRGTENGQDGVYAGAADYLPAVVMDDEMAVHASQPKKIAGKELQGEIKETVDDLYWNIETYVEGLNLQKQDLFISAGEALFITKGPNQDISELNAEEEKEYGGFQVYFSEAERGGRPEMIARKDDLQFNIRTTDQESAERELKRIVDTYNNDNPSIADNSPSYAELFQHVNDNYEFVDAATVTPESFTEAKLYSERDPPEAFDFNQFKVENGQKVIENSGTAPIRQLDRLNPGQ